MDKKDELGRAFVRVLLRVVRAMSSFRHERRVAVELGQCPGARGVIAPGKGADAHLVLDEHAGALSWQLDDRVRREPALLEATCEMTVSLPC